MQAEDTIRVEVAVASRRFHRGDPAFLSQVLALRDAMTAAGVGIQDSAQSGTKGLAEVEPLVQTIVAGGAGLAALCSVAKEWLRQRTDRVMRLTVRADDGTERVLEIEGENVSDAVLAAFAKDATKLSQR